MKPLLSKSKSSSVLGSRVLVSVVWYIAVYGRVVRNSGRSLAVVAGPVDSRIARITAEDGD